MLTHSRYWAPLLLVAALAFSTVSAQQPGAPAAASREAAAKALIDLLSKGEFDKATQDFDAAMRNALPAAELKKTWERVVEQAGAFQKQVGARQEQAGEFVRVFVTCEFAKSQLDARVVFEKNGKITGLFFGPVQRPVPEGGDYWEGTLTAGAMKLRLVFYLFKQKDGTYAGTMDSPDQGAKGLALDEVVIQGDSVRLEFKKGGMVFEGKRDQAGREIAGNLKQAGQTFPLVLKKAEKPKEPRRTQVPQKPYPYDALDVAYENKVGGIKLAGTLTLPRAAHPVPAVLLITGSGAQDRDETVFGHKPFLVLADYLTRRGLAVLRVDDRGVGGSTGKVQDATTADFAGDVLAGIEFLKGRREIDRARIGLIGHSEGGIIAPLAASRSPDVAFIVLLAGTGLPGDETLYLQGAALLKVAGADAAGLARQRSIQETMFALLRQEKNNDAAEKKIRAALKDLTAKLGADEQKDVERSLPALDGQVQRVLTPWFRHFLDYDPRPALRKVACPVLALNGEKDLQVVPEPNLQAIAAALKEGGNQDVTVQMLPKLNHLFQTCDSGAVSEYASIEETIAPVALETIAGWIAKRTASK